MVFVVKNEKVGFLFSLLFLLSEVLSSLFRFFFYLQKSSRGDAIKKSSRGRFVDIQI